MSIPIELPLNLEDFELKLLDEALGGASGHMTSTGQKFSEEPTRETCTYPPALMDGLRVGLHALPVPSLTLRQADTAFQIVAELENGIDYSSELWEHLETLLKSLDLILPPREYEVETGLVRIYREYRECLLALVLRVQSKFPREVRPKRFLTVGERVEDELAGFKLSIQRSLQANCFIWIGVMDHMSEISASNEASDDIWPTHGRFTCTLETSVRDTFSPLDFPMPDEWLGFSDKLAWERHLALLEAAEPRLTSTIERWLARTD